MGKNKSVFQRGFKTLAERIAEQQRELLGLSVFSPLNAFDLAEKLEILVCPVNDLLPETEARKLTQPFDQSQQFSALWMPNCDGDPIIIYNSHHSAYRQQSDLMHEIAHILRKHETPYEVKKLCQAHNLRSYNKLHEEEAKYLGGCLQIPRAGLLWALKNKYSHTQISDYYSASTEMVRYRLNASGAERQSAYRNKY